MSDKKTSAPKISIIVPVYNVEQYLRRCLDSIVAQIFPDWECILIDDGSSDNSGAICEEYAEKDSRFRVIHQENKGVSAARNAGLDCAHGEWIGFVDSDDWIEPEMYEYLYNDAIKTKSDCIICGFYGEQRKRIQKQFNTKLALKLIFLPFPKGFGGYSILRLVASEQIERIRFDTSISYMEDTKFFYEVFSRCKRIFWDNEPLYHYERHEHSVTQQYGLTEQAKSGIEMLKGIGEKETDRTVRKAIRLNYVSFLLSKAHSYIVHENISNDFYLIVSKLKPELLSSLFTYGLTLKDKVFFMIIESSLLTKIFLNFRKRFKKNM